MSRLVHLNVTAKEIKYKSLLAACFASVLMLAPDSIDTILQCAINFPYFVAGWFKKKKKTEQSKNGDYN